MPPNVMNVLKTEISHHVLVPLDMLKLTESVNLVITIVQLVPLPPVLVPNVMTQEFKLSDLQNIVNAQKVISKKPQVLLTVPLVTGDVNLVSLPP